MTADLSGRGPMAHGADEDRDASEWGTTNVVVDFAERRALAGITMALPRGEVSAVVGGDGAGKTTLLDVLAGRILPTSGSASHPPLRDIGLQPSTSGVWLDLSVAENIAFVGQSYKMGRRRIAERAQLLLERADLNGIDDRLGRQLSGGMRQKLGFVLAMLHSPALLLLDEPTTGVDPVSRVELWRLIAQAAADGAAVLMATTYLDEAERAQRVLVLDEGRPLAAGRPDDVVASVPGTVARVPQRPAVASRAWRRGTAFHAWFPPGEKPAGQPLQPDMEDTVIALTLADRERRSARTRQEASHA